MGARYQTTTKNLPLPITHHDFFNKSNWALSLIFLRPSVFCNLLEPQCGTIFLLRLTFLLTCYLEFLSKFQFLNNLQKVKRKRKDLPLLYDKSQLNTSKSFSISCPGYLPFILEMVVTFHDSKSVLIHSTFTVASVLGQFLRLKRGKVQALSCKSSQSPTLIK